MERHNKWAYQNFIEEFGVSSDVVLQPYYFDQNETKKMYLIYCKTIVDVKTLQKDVISSIQEMVEEHGYAILADKGQVGRVQLDVIEKSSNWNDLATDLYSGAVFS
ncbi:spore germination protein [Bacillus sp. JCM 19041]|uniref:spore germination protein n=1 Tax=Bacillus sp. JCM 19041 TaxID=1460637 RepID=UPI0006D27727